MAYMPLPGVDLGHKTVKDLIEDCLSIFPDCTQRGNNDMKLFMGNTMDAFRLWAKKTEQSAEESGSVEKVLESRPNALYKIKFALFTISNILEWYKKNASEDEKTAQYLNLINTWINDLDTACSAIVR